MSTANSTSALLTRMPEVPGLLIGAGPSSVTRLSLIGQIPTDPRSCGARFSGLPAIPRPVPPASLLIEWCSLL
jgi:hypothetical protein